MLQNKSAHTPCSVLARILQGGQKLSIFYMLLGMVTIYNTQTKFKEYKVENGLAWRFSHRTWFERSNWSNICPELLYCDLLRFGSFMSLNLHLPWLFIFLHVGKVRLGNKGWKDPGIFSLFHQFVSFSKSKLTVYLLFPMHCFRG